jgi:hypothetical protein
MNRGLQSLLDGTSAWTADAACAGQYELYDTAAELPVLASTQRVKLRTRAVAAARRMCSTCEVLRRCEEASSTEEDGFWAGMTEEERATRWFDVRQVTEHNDEDEEIA